MNNKIIITGIVILVLVGGGLYIANQQSQQVEEAKMAQEKAAMKVKEDAAMEEKKAMEKEKIDTGTPQQEAMEKKKAVMEKDDTKMVKTSSSRYVEYSKAALDQAAGNRRVLYFYANWCPTCKTANEDFTKNSSKIPEDMVVIRVNYNDTDTDQEEKDLAKKYGITYQHTFVQIDSQGKEVTKWNGGQTDELLANIK